MWENNRELSTTSYVNKDAGKFSVYSETSYSSPIEQSEGNKLTSLRIVMYCKQDLRYCRFIIIQNKDKFTTRMYVNVM